MHGAFLLRTFERNHASRANEIKFEGNAACHEPRRARLSRTFLEIHDASLMQLF